MKLLEISPFVRYAYRDVFSPKKRLYTSLDCRLFYFRGGEGSIEIDNIVYPIRRGTLLLWQSGTRYRWIVDNPLDITILNFDLTDERSAITEPFAPIVKLDSREVETESKSIIFEDCPEFNKPIVLQNTDSFAAELDLIINEHSAKQPFYSAKISGILKKVISDIIRMNSTLPLTSKATKKLDIVIQYIHNNFQDNISNSTLAQLVNYHPYYLNRLMLSTKGVTLHQYLINYRLSVAEKLLLTTDESISSIAVKIGFSNITCFTTSFKKKNYMTPSNFRDKLSE